MNAAQTGIENLDLEKLNDKDKTELRQFLANEQQRSQIQARTLSLLPPSSSSFSLNYQRAGSGLLVAVANERNDVQRRTT